MSKFQPTSPAGLSVIERPRCPACDQAQMNLFMIEPGPHGFDHRTFECQNCGSVRMMIISSDPMNANVRGWLAGELRSPE
jgi:hypothetical protein